LLLRAAAVIAEVSTRRKTIFFTSKVPPMDFFTLLREWWYRIERREAYLGNRAEE
jgi:hypothetical protein